MTVAALFVRRTSHYKTMAGVDAYDEDRDALTWRGGVPGVFHPPCRGWGKLSHFSRHSDSELALSLWAMHMVRVHGGVLEHPYASRLWKASGCIGYGLRDNFGGVLLPVFQSWWGHRALKQSCFYVVGPVPELPFFPPVASRSVESMCRAQREETPVDLAQWLVAVAQDCAKVAA